MKKAGDLVLNDLIEHRGDPCRVAKVVRNQPTVGKVVVRLRAGEAEIAEDIPQLLPSDFGLVLRTGESVKLLGVETTQIIAPEFEVVVLRQALREIVENPSAVNRHVTIAERALRDVGQSVEREAPEDRPARGRRRAAD